MSRSTSPGPTKAKHSAGRKRVKRARQAAPRKPSVPMAPSGEKDDSLNPGLYGIDNGRHAGDAAEASVEDPLLDWPEGPDAGDDEWLLDRGGEGVQQPEE